MKTVICLSIFLIITVVKADGKLLPRETAPTTTEVVTDTTITIVPSSEGTTESEPPVTIETTEQPGTEGTTEEPVTAETTEEPVTAETTEEPDTTEATEETTSASTASPGPSTTPGSICPDDTVSYHPHPTDCHLFIECYQGNSYEMACPPNYYFSDSQTKCVLASESECCANDQSTCS